VSSQWKKHDYIITNFGKTKYKFYFCAGGTNKTNSPKVYSDRERCTPLHIKVIKRLVKCRILLFIDWTRIVQLVQRLATGWMVWDSNLGGGEIFHIYPDWPWAHPASTMDQVIPGGKVARA